MSRSLSAEVQYALVQNFSRQAPINVTITSFAVVWTTWLMSSLVPLSILIPWAVIHLALVGVLLNRWFKRYRARKLGLPSRIKSNRPIAERAAIGKRRAVISALVSGLLWGATVFFIPGLPPEYKAAMVIIVAALAGGATTTLSAIPLAASVYAVTSIMPFSIYFLSQGTDPASITLGALAAVMTAAMMWASRSVHGTFLDDIAARIDATTTLEQLRADREDWLQVAQSTDAFALIDGAKGLKFNNQAFVSFLSRLDGRPLAGASLSELVTRLVPSEEAAIGLVTREEREQRYLRLEIEPDEPMVERLTDGRWVRSVIKHTGNNSFVWLIQDITAERSRESTEIKLRARLAEAKQLHTIGQFAGGVAHDFNNVLGAVMSFGSYIAQNATTPDQKNAATRIVSACERGAGMVQNILQLATASRVDKGPFAFAKAFQQAVNLLPTRKPAHVTLEIEDTTNSACIDANESQVVQLILNLVVNGFAALKRGAGRVTVRASRVEVDTATASQFFDAAAGLDSFTELPDGSHQFIFGMLLPNTPYIKISVEDTGSGIDPSLLSRIFDPFVSTKEETLRTGFGLAVVRSVVLVSEGALCVRTAVGRGTTFEVYIGIVEAPIFIAKVPAVTGARQVSCGVLIVDDDADVADGLVLALKGLGHNPKTFYDTREALQAIIDQPKAWPVVVTDVAMPGMQGDELAAEIRKINPDTRVFLYTGRATDELRAAAARIGVEGVLQKPIDPRALADIIGRAV